MVGATGIEPVAPAMSRQCSPAELRAHPPDDAFSSPAPGPFASCRVDRLTARRLNRQMDLPVAPALSGEAAPAIVYRPGRQTVPVIFASPHSGRSYPPEFVAAARLDALSLRRSEDSFVDELFAAAPDHGAPLLAATFPRAFCDANREPWELDPAMFADSLPPWVNTTSARVGAGLGTIARVVASGETIYRGKLPFAEAERRVRSFWQPFHETLEALITGTRAMFGSCLLVDCHSMPSQGTSRTGGKTTDFVLGDAHGTACNPLVTQFIERALVELGYVVRRNDPYAGGYITRHYGRPRERVHVLQIEIARELYMDESRIERLPRFDAVQKDMTALVETIARTAARLLPI
jgi:N-formylglutamate amidohydrolase